MKKVLNLLTLLFAATSGLAQSQSLQSRQLAVNGQEFHYYQLGESGSPVVLLTGYATTSNFWNRNFVDCLAQKHKVYLIDYAGINSAQQPSTLISLPAMASDINQLVTNLKLTKPALIGWSMGGGVALQASFDEPTNFKHLFLLASLVPGTESGILIAAKPHQPFKNDAEVLNYVFERNLYKYKPTELTQLQPQFINGQVANLFPSLEVIKGQANAVHHWVNAPAAIQAFAKSQVAATFYIPQHDAIINQSVAQAAIKNYANYNLVMIESAGHAVAFQQPITICQNILTTLAK
jgi:pimeloyl-ACP methyl ester carboxylesterase